jgi:putative addiction module component (TIGR02574 family)
MSETFETVAIEALSLSATERAELAHRLLHSLEETVTKNEQEDPNLDEVMRRTAQIDSGELKLRPLEEFIAELRAEYKV